MRTRHGAVALALWGLSACGGEGDDVKVQSQVQAASATPPTMESFCTKESSNSWDVLRQFLGTQISVKCNKSEEQNAWSSLGREYDQWVDSSDRAGLLARADVDYCMLREADSRAVEKSTSIKYLGKFGVRQETHINEYDPGADSRHVKGYRDLYVYLFGLRTHLQRQFFEVRFPRNDFKDWRYLTYPRFDWPTRRLIYQSGWMHLPNHASYLLGRSVEGEKNITLEVPIIGDLLRLSLQNAQRQGLQRADAWDWMDYGDFFDKMIEQGGTSTQLASYNQAAFPSKSVGRWWDGVADVHQDYTAAKNIDGVRQRLVFTNSEAFAAAGVFDAGVGTIISALTGTHMPGWIDALLSLLSLKIKAGVEFEPASRLQLYNYVRTPPYPTPGPDASYMGLTDIIEDNGVLDMDTRFEVKPEISITLTLRLLFFSKSWNWDLNIPGASTSAAKTVAEAKLEVDRANNKDGKAATYRSIHLPDSNQHLYNQQAKQWIDQCLAVPAEADPPEQPDPPEYTDDLPSTPGICLVDAACEGGGPYFRLCLCQGPDKIDYSDCTDSSALTEQELQQLNQALGHPCGR